MILASGIAAWAGAIRAHDYRLGAITITHPWAAAELRVGRPVHVYMALLNRAATSDRLRRGASPFGSQVFAAAPDGRGFRALGAIEMPPNQPVILRPGGPFVMMLNLRRALNVGDRFALNIQFEHAGSIEVEVAVENTPSH